MNTRLKAAGLLTAGVVTGGLVFGAYSANADTSNSASSSATSTPSTSTQVAGQPPANTNSKAPTGTPPAGAPSGNHGAPGETVLTGTDLAKATAAAKAAVPGATIVRAETDTGDAKYEVHVTINGTQKTVKLNADFTLKAVEDGMGK